MTNSLLLLKIQLLNLFSYNRVVHSKDPKEKRKLLFYLAMMCLVAVMVVGYSFSLAYGYAYMGMTDMLPLIMMTVTSVVVMVTTFLKSNGLLFGLKDYDMVMSLPVKSETIIVSRLLYMYILNIMFALGVMLPSLVAYSLFADGTVLFYVLYILSIFFIPLFPIIIATVAGAVITFISIRFKYRNMVNIVLTLLLIIGIMLASFGSSDVQVERITELSALLLEELTKLYPLANLYHQALIEGQWLSFAAYVGVSLAAFWVFVKILSLVYPKIQTALTTHRKRNDYQLGLLKTSSPFRALYFKELKRYFSSSVYVINTCLGLIFTLLLAGVLLFLSPEQLETSMQLPGLAYWVNKVIPLVVSLMVALSCTTSAAISIEGNRRWIPASLPVSRAAILNSKKAVNLTLALPTILISGVLLTIGLELNVWEAVFVFITPIAYAFFVAEVGIAMNVKFPNYDWTNEVQIVKQGAATFFAMLINLIVAAVPAVLILLFSSINVYLLLGGTTLVVALLTVLLYKRTLQKSAGLFM